MTLRHRWAGPERVFPQVGGERRSHSYVLYSILAASGEHNVASCTRSDGCGNEHRRELTPRWRTAAHSGVGATVAVSGMNGHHPELALSRLGTTERL
jgi:hypothetical protein